MTEHTPGPWAEQDEYYIYGNNGDTYVVQLCNETEEEKANAHLIAAAPDLLEALEDMLDLFGYYHGPRMDKAIATVTKAKGDDPVSGEHKPIKAEDPERPTIHELEAILDETPSSIEILPNGEVRTKGQTP